MLTVDLYKSDIVSITINHVNSSGKKKCKNFIFLILLELNSQEFYNSVTFFDSLSKENLSPNLLSPLFVRKKNV